MSEKPYGSRPLQGPTSKIILCLISFLLLTKTPAAAGPGERVNQSWTPLMIAAWNGDIIGLRKLLVKKPALEKKNSDGDTALILACEAGHVLCVTALVDAGADIGAKSGRIGFTPLMFLADKGLVKPLEYFLRHGARVDAKTDHGQTALYIASYRGYAEVVEMLLRFRADPNVRDKVGQTPLYLAVEGGHDYVAKTLLANGAKPNVVCGPEKRDPLIVATLAGNADMVRFLIKRGARATTRDSDGMTALMYAARDGDQEVARILLEHGADYDEKDNQGFSALGWAAQTGHTDIVTLMLSGRFNRPKK